MTEKKTFLIVGLGNPGDKYATTRHNIGFQFLDYLAGRQSLNFSSSKFQAGIIRTELWEHSALLVKPETFMNRSGQSVGAIVRYFNINTANIIVIHDDIDLDVGRVKIAMNRGAGGHNGIRSIIEHLGDKKFIRIRIGVGRPEEFMPVERYVLSSFSSKEKELIETCMVRVEEGVKCIFSEGHAAAMNTINVDR